MSDSIDDLHHSSVALTREQVRSIDLWAIEVLGLPGIALMENAGRGAAQLLLERGVSGPVCVVVGGGNNGGDGYVIARHLAIAGIEVELLSLVPIEKLSGDAEVNAYVAKNLNLPTRAISLPDDLELWRERLDRADWVVDGLLGTGLTEELRSPYDVAIQSINDSPSKVLALDVPSGLDCDIGTPWGISVEANLTITFVALKQGFLNPEAARWLGDVEVVGIGVPIPFELSR